MSDFYTDGMCPPLLVPDRPAIDLRLFPLGTQCQTNDGRNMILRFIEDDAVWLSTSHRAAQIDCLHYHPSGCAVGNRHDGPGTEDNDLDLATLHLTTTALRNKGAVLDILPKGTRLQTKVGRWVELGAHDRNAIVGRWLVTRNEAMPPEAGQSYETWTHTGAFADTSNRHRGQFKLDLTRLVPPVWRGLEEMRSRLRAERTKQIIANLDAWE